MLHFKYKIKNSQNINHEFIYWKSWWDTKKDPVFKNVDFSNDFSDMDTIHPFKYTLDYIDAHEHYTSMMSKLRRHKQKEVWLFTPSRPSKKRIEKNKKLGLVDMRDVDIFNKVNRKYSKKDIEDELNPKHIKDVGDVVVVNEATLALCEMLKNKSDIPNKSGYTDPYYYWCKLLGSLSLLWD